jgi:hypothetical protein
MLRQSGPYGRSGSNPTNIQRSSGSRTAEKMAGTAFMADIDSYSTALRHSANAPCEQGVLNGPNRGRRRSRRGPGSATAGGARAPFTRGEPYPIEIYISPFLSISLYKGVECVQCKCIRGKRLRRKHLTRAEGDQNCAHKKHVRAQPADGAARDRSPPRSFHVRSRRAGMHVSRPPCAAAGLSRR